MACCAMCNVLVSTTRLPNGPLTRLPFGRSVIAPSTFDVEQQAIGQLTSVLAAMFSQDFWENQFAQAGIFHGDTAQAARVPGAMPPITVTNAATASAANTGAGKRDGAGSSASFMYMRTATRI